MVTAIASTMPVATRITSQRRPCPPRPPGRHGPAESRRGEGGPVLAGAASTAGACSGLIAPPAGVDGLTVLLRRPDRRRPGRSLRGRGWTLRCAPPAAADLRPVWR